MKSKINTCADDLMNLKQGASGGGGGGRGDASINLNISGSDLRNVFALHEL